MPILLRSPHQTRWLQWFLILVLGCNIVLILWGGHLVPATLTTANGSGTLLFPLILQVVIALFALFGPLSFQQCRSSIWISLLLGTLFAVTYGGIVLLEFHGIFLGLNIWLVFLVPASLAGFLVSWRTGQIAQGVVAAIWTLVIGTAIWSLGVLLINYSFWGTHQWYLYWLKDGAIEEFREAHSTDLQVFLLQDLQGALLFHTILSGVLGAICGLITSGAASLLRSFQRRFFARHHS